MNLLMLFHHKIIFRCALIGSNMMKDPVRSKVRLQGVSDESLPKVFNDFFTCFEEHNFSFYMSDLKSSLTFD